MVAIPPKEVAEGIFKTICYICLIAAVCLLPSVVIVSLFEQQRLAKQRQRKPAANAPQMSSGSDALKMNRSSSTRIKLLSD